MYNFLNYFFYKITKPKIKIGYGSKVDKNTVLDHSVIIEDEVKISKSEISPFTHIYDNCKLYEVNINSYSYIAPMAYIAYTSIGKFCSIGPRFQCAGANHPTNLVSTSPVFYSSNKQCGVSFTDKTTFNEIEPIQIANDVWIGSNVCINGGVKIGNGVVIAAGSVVIDDVPDYAIVAGVPAKIIKFRFEKDIIEKLLNSKWWDAGEDKLKNLQSKMNSTDIHAFISELEKK